MCRCDRCINYPDPFLLTPLTKTLQTQDISAPCNWCRSVRSVQHQCRNVSRTLRHWYQTVSTSSKHIFAKIVDTEERFTVILFVIIIKQDHWFYSYTQEYTADDYPLYSHTVNDFLLNYMLREYSQNVVIGYSLSSMNVNVYILM